MLLIRKQKMKKMLSFILNSPHKLMTSQIWNIKWTFLIYPSALLEQLQLYGKETHVVKQQDFTNIKFQGAK